MPAITIMGHGFVGGTENAAPTCTRRRIPSLRDMIQAFRTRRMLATLDDRMLSDIGVGRAEASYEAGRRPWDLAAPR
jgi:uncharacterized protein YjiS (DUF1127 family)